VSIVSVVLWLLICSDRLRSIHAKEPSSLTCHTWSSTMCLVTVSVGQGLGGKVKKYTIISCWKRHLRSLTSRAPCRSTCALSRPLADTIFSEAKGQARYLARRWESTGTPNFKSMLGDLLDRSKCPTAKFLADIARQGSSLQPSAKEQPQWPTGTYSSTLGQKVIFTRM
jgi:hypothetical protein